MNGNAAPGASASRAILRGAGEPAMTKAQQKTGLRGRVAAVTRAGLQALRDQLARPASAPELTPGGASESLVHADIDAAKRAALARGERRLRDASAMSHRDHRLAALKGSSRADLNQAVQRRERIAREAAHGKDHRPVRSTQPERTR